MVKWALEEKQKYTVLRLLMFINLSKYHHNQDRTEQFYPNTTL